jgi:poly-beta-1,6-N-acetyl-D-glucosamine synthase
MAPSPQELPPYAIVSPVRDEAEHLARTAESIVAQTHRPTRWVIVDDGSSDDTVEVASHFAEKHDWISLIRSGDEGQRARGGRIVRAFNAGLQTLAQIPEFVVKLDGDLFLPPHYFAWVAETFARAPRAGIVGGYTRVFDGERWVADATSRHNLSGVAKAYRRECLKDIGGLRASMGWDGIDEYGARARGWQVHVLTELPILHYKARGSQQRWLHARWEEGTGAHYMNYRPEFMLARTAYRMLREPPPLLGGLVSAGGFLFAALSGAPTVDDERAAELLRSEQRARLLGIVRLRGSHAPLPELPDGGPAFWATGRSGATPSRNGHPHGSIQTWLDV